MMTQLTMTLTILTSVAIVKAENPMKVAILLLFLSILIMTQMTWSSENSIMPQIYFMMFAGGILVMMMILAALSPNQKAKQLKTAMAMLIAVAFMSTHTLTNLPDVSSTHFASTMMTQSENFLFLAMAVLLYFSGVMMILDSMKNAMRTFQ